MIKTIIPENEKKLEIVEDIKKELLEFNPKSIVLFGSLSRYVLGTYCIARDIDLMYVGENDISDIVKRTEREGNNLFSIKPSDVKKTADWLRYDDLIFYIHAKLFFYSFTQKYPIEVLCKLLIGSEYQKYGFTQRYEKGLETYRGGKLRRDSSDLSSHSVLFGNEWWNNVCSYARQRRGPLNYVSDLIAKKNVF
jgi:predicted nucleotidyltransferase